MFPFKDIRQPRLTEVDERRQIGTDSKLQGLKTCLSLFAMSYGSAVTFSSIHIVNKISL